MYIKDCIRDGVAPLTPEEHELKEAGYYEKAKLYLMRDTHAEELEEELKRDEINYAIETLGRNHYIIIHPSTVVEEPAFLEIEIRNL